MKPVLFFAAFLLGIQGISCCGQSAVGLKEALKDKFLIGTALNVMQVRGEDQSSTDILSAHFNAVTAENCMKAARLQPREGEFDFDDADRFVRLGEEMGMFIIGHTLVWHSSVPAWFFVDAQGRDVSRTVLVERMRDHIFTVVGRYKGRVHGWDVVNEAMLDDGTLRRSKFLEIIGEHYIRLAFEFARRADPDAELYYNDYSMTLPEKRKGVAALVAGLQRQGIRVNGIGMQGHMSLGYPSVESYERSIAAFSGLGVQVMITELDITALPFPRGKTGADVSTDEAYSETMNPYPDGLPAAKAEEQRKRYNDFFSLFIRHKDKISRVTLWGISDKDSWRNDWPISGRTDYPLLFDRRYEAKPMVGDIIRLAAGDGETEGLSTTP